MKQLKRDFRKVQRPSTRAHPDEPDGYHDDGHCFLCDLVRQDAPTMQANKTALVQSSSKPKHLLCSECLTPIGRGISHQCNKETLQRNLAKLGDTTKQRMAARGKKNVAVLS